MDIVYLLPDHCMLTVCCQCDKSIKILASQTLIRIVFVSTRHLKWILVLVSFECDYLSACSHGRGLVRFNWTRFSFFRQFVLLRHVLKLIWTKWELSLAWKHGSLASESLRCSLTLWMQMAYPVTQGAVVNQRAEGTRRNKRRRRQRGQREDRGGIYHICK